MQLSLKKLKSIFGNISGDFSISKESMKKKAKVIVAATGVSLSLASCGDDEKKDATQETPEKPPLPKDEQKTLENVGTAALEELTKVYNTAMGDGSKVTSEEFLRNLGSDAASIKTNLASKLEAIKTKWGTNEGQQNAGKALVYGPLAESFKKLDDADLKAAAVAFAGSPTQAGFDAFLTKVKEFGTKSTNALVELAKAKTELESFTGLKSTINGKENSFAKAEDFKQLLAAIDSVTAAQFGTDFKPNSVKEIADKIKELKISTNTDSLKFNLGGVDFSVNLKDLNPLQQFIKDRNNTRKEGSNLEKMLGSYADKSKLSQVFNKDTGKTTVTTLEQYHTFIEILIAALDSAAVNNPNDVKANDFVKAMNMLVTLEMDETEFKPSEFFAYIFNTNDPYNNTGSINKNALKTGSLSIISLLSRVDLSNELGGSDYTSLRKLIEGQIGTFDANTNKRAGVNKTNIARLKKNIMALTGASDADFDGTGPSSANMLDKLVLTFFDIDNSDPANPKYKLLNLNEHNAKMSALQLTANQALELKNLRKEMIQKFVMAVSGNATSDEERAEILAQICSDYDGSDTLVGHDGKRTINQSKFATTITSAKLNNYMDMCRNIDKIGAEFANASIHRNTYGSLLDSGRMCIAVGKDNAASLPASKANFKTAVREGYVCGARTNAVTTDVNLDVEKNSYIGYEPEYGNDKLDSFFLGLKGSVFKTTLQSKIDSSLSLNGINPIVANFADAVHSISDSPTFLNVTKCSNIAANIATPYTIDAFATNFTDQNSGYNVFAINPIYASGAIAVAGDVDSKFYVSNNKTSHQMASGVIAANSVHSRIFGSKKGSKFLLDFNDKTKNLKIDNLGILTVGAAQKNSTLLHIKGSGNIGNLIGITSQNFIAANVKLVAIYKEHFDNLFNINIKRMSYAPMYLGDFIDKSKTNAIFTAASKLPESNVIVVMNPSNNQAVDYLNLNRIGAYSSAIRLKTESGTFLSIVGDKCFDQISELRNLHKKYKSAVVLGNGGAISSTNYTFKCSDYGVANADQFDLKSYDETKGNPLIKTIILSCETVTAVTLRKPRDEISTQKISNFVTTALYNPKVVSNNIFTDAFYAGENSSIQGNFAVTADKFIALNQCYIGAGPLDIAHGIFVFRNDYDPNHLNAALLLRQYGAMPLVQNDNVAAKIGVNDHAGVTRFPDIFNDVSLKFNDDEADYAYGKFAKENNPAVDCDGTGDLRVNTIAQFLSGDNFYKARDHLFARQGMSAALGGVAIAFSNVQPLENMYDNIGISFKHFRSNTIFLNAKESIAISVMPFSDNITSIDTYWNDAIPNANHKSIVIPSSITRFSGNCIKFLTKRGSASFDDNSIYYFSTAKISSVAALDSSDSTCAFRINLQGNALSANYKDIVSPYPVSIFDSGNLLFLEKDGNSYKEVEPSFFTKNGEVVRIIPLTNSPKSLALKGNLEAFPFDPVGNNNDNNIAIGIYITNNNTKITTLHTGIIKKNILLSKFGGSLNGNIDSMTTAFVADTSVLNTIFGVHEAAELSSVNALKSETIITRQLTNEQRQARDNKKAFVESVMLDTTSNALTLTSMSQNSTSDVAIRSLLSNKLSFTKTDKFGAVTSSDTSMPIGFALSEDGTRKSFGLSTGTKSFKVLAFNSKDEAAKFANSGFGLTTFGPRGLIMNAIASFGNIENAKDPFSISDSEGKKSFSSEAIIQAGYGTQGDNSISIVAGFDNKNTVTEHPFADYTSIKTTFNGLVSALRYTGITEFSKDLVMISNVLCALNTGISRSTVSSRDTGINGTPLLDNYELSRSALVSSITLSFSNEIKGESASFGFNGKGGFSTNGTSNYAVGVKAGFNFGVSVKR
jgi:hypothetical protein